MVTMYYVQQGKLALSHFCMLPNRPRMLLGSSDAKTLKFYFDSACDIAVPTETHMHALTITFDGPDTITQDWQLFADGKASGQHRFTFQRVKG